jgi:peptidoglycan hydrolase-like protein with peptidoglycan-binding domain
MTPYTGGKYVADGVWDPHHYDQQLGIVPVALRMIELRPDLALPGVPTGPTPSAEPEHPAPVSHPYEGVVNARWVQHAMNLLRVHGTPIDEDDNYGRETSRAVANFQFSQHILVDGMAGPITIARIKQALQEAGL